MKELLQPAPFDLQTSSLKYGHATRGQRPGVQVILPDGRYLSDVLVAEGLARVKGTEHPRTGVVYNKDVSHKYAFTYEALVPRLATLVHLQGVAYKQRLGIWAL